MRGMIFTNFIKPAAFESKKQKEDSGQSAAVFIYQALYTVQLRSDINMTDYTPTWVCLERPQFCLQLYSHLII